MGVPTFLITATVEAILAQRLVRRICPQCREQIEPSEEVVTQFRITGYEPNGNPFFRGRGCEHCNNTGYKGRVGLFELMIIDDDLRDMIMANASIDALRDASQKKGMVPLRIAGINFMHEGITTAEEVLAETIVES
jgi:type IV pilus assembly protein PilB